MEDHGTMQSFIQNSAIKNKLHYKGPNYECDNYCFIIHMCNIIYYFKFVSLFYLIETDLAFILVECYW